MRRWGVAIVCLLLAAGVGLGQTEISEEESTPEIVISDEVKKILAELLPKEAAVLNEPLFFSPSNLYKYINGAAESFLQYHFEALGHQEYKEGQTEITVDVYDMGDPLNAFGMYAAERSPKNQYIPIGAEGYLDQFILNFLQDRYYVKISVFSEDQKTEGWLKRYAEAVSKKIEKGKALPEMLRRLAPENLVAHSEKWVIRSPLGFEFLAPALSGQYRFGEVESTLVISEAESEADAGKRLERLRQMFGKTGSMEAYPSLGESAFHGKNEYLGEAIVFTLGKCVVILTHPPAQVDGFIAKVKQRLS